MVSARKAAGLTQVEMAQRLKVGQPFVSKMERGDSYVDVMVLIDWCAACGVLPGMLLDPLAMRSEALMPAHITADSHLERSSSPS